MKTNDNNKYINSLIEFMNQCSCSFTTVQTISEELDRAGFKKLDLSEKWSITYSDKFYITKNDSAIFAFSLGKKPIAENGFKIIAAHSDSPTFRIKPNAVISSEGEIIKLNIENYGGGILNTWYDRPLSISGRVILKGETAFSPITRIIKIEKPIMIIPQLPIHFNRAVNDGVKISKQKDMLPICGIITDTAERENLIINLITEELKVNAEQILDLELSLHPTEKATLVGINNEFITSGRLDDLSMVHAATTAFLENQDGESNNILAIFDNEETGSKSKQGAGSPTLSNILKRISVQLSDNNNNGDEDYYRAIANSFMLSADNAHAFNPNHPEKFDITNHPTMGGGVTIKINANGKYMTDAHSSAIFAEICKSANIPYQYFVNHSDIAGGSTLGNILTSQIDIDGVDIGNPIWSMHSAIETGSVADHTNMIEAMHYFYKMNNK